MQKVTIKDVFWLVALVIVVAIGSITLYEYWMKTYYPEDMTAYFDEPQIPPIPIPDNTPSSDHSYQLQYPDEFDNPKNYIRLVIKEKRNVGLLFPDVLIEFELFSLAKEAHYSNLMVNVVWKDKNDEVIGDEKELLKVNLPPEGHQEYEIKKLIPENAKKVDLVLLSADAEL